VRKVESIFLLRGRSARDLGDQKKFETRGGEICWRGLKETIRQCLFDCLSTGFQIVFNLDVCLVFCLDGCVAVDCLCLDCMSV
jgi:hypothetical protein